MKLVPSILVVAALAFGVSTVFAQSLPTEVDSTALVTSSQVDVSVDGSAPLSAVSADDVSNVKAKIDMRSPVKNLGGSQRPLGSAASGGGDAARIAAATAGMSRAQKEALAAAAMRSGSSTTLATGGTGLSNAHLVGSGKALSKGKSADLHAGTGIAGSKTAAAAMPTAGLSSAVETPVGSSLGEALGDGIRPQLGPGIRPELGPGLGRGIPSMRRARLASSGAVRGETNSIESKQHGEGQKAHEMEDSNKAAAGVVSTVHKNLHESLQSSRPKSLKQRRADERHAACPSCRD